MSDDICCTISTSQSSLIFLSSNGFRNLTYPGLRINLSPTLYL